MGQSQRGIADGSIPFHRPLCDLGDQTARPFVSLVEIDVVQRNTDAQVTNDLDLFVTVSSIVCGIFRIQHRRRLHFDRSINGMVDGRLAQAADHIKINFITNRFGSKPRRCRCRDC